MMKHESGFKKTAQTIVTEGQNMRSQIDKTMSPQSGSGKIMPAGRGRISPKPVKGKVIPLRQEDIDSGGGNVKKRRFMILLAVVLSAVLGLIITRSMGITFADGKVPKKADSSIEVNVENDSQYTSIWKVPEKISNRVRDITRSIKNETESPESSGLSQLTVRGIVVYNNNSKSAIVGDMIVRVGDTVKGVKICTITSNSVEFEKDGVRWTRSIE